MDKVTKILFVFVIFAALVQSQDNSSIRLVGRGKRIPGSFLRVEKERKNHQKLNIYKRLNQKGKFPNIFTGPKMRVFIMVWWAIALLYKLFLLFLLWWAVAMSGFPRHTVTTANFLQETEL
jgi:hypothetical protein